MKAPMVGAWPRVKGGYFIGLYVLLAGLTLIVSCGDDDNPTDSNGTPATNEVANNLVFTRYDSTTMPMATDLAVCCGIWEAGYIDEIALKVMYYDTTMHSSGWKLFVLVDSVSVGVDYLLPTEPASQSAVSMFAFDYADLNETNSETSESSGAITINSFSCGPPVTLDVTIDATLGSEFFFGPTIEVSGNFSCTIHTNPAPFGCDFSF